MDDYGYDGFVKRTKPVEKLDFSMPSAAERLPEPDPNDPLHRRAGIKAASPQMILDGDSYLLSYADRISAVVKSTQVTGSAEMFGNHLQTALDNMLRTFMDTHAEGRKVILVGNGGSSAICSHVAIDLSKNAGIRAISLNDFPTLTCLSNDFGYDQVFAKQIEYHAKPNDCLVCISTGGKSPNILNAMQTFKDMGGTRTYTFSGMKANNTLRTMGSINFYTPSNDYGIVEIAHLTLLHSLCPCLG